jgi:flotillin
MLVAVVVLVVLTILIIIVKQYRRCPSNKILVIYGKVAGQRAAKCLHGGGAFVWPLIQDYHYLSLEPLPIEIELTGALSSQNIKVNVPSTVTIGISTDPDVMNNAAERLLGLSEQQIADHARDIILGQMRLVIATMSIEEINKSRDEFLKNVNHHVETELNKIGLKAINVNIRDISDESGYIQAIGQKAAAEAINQAKVDVAVFDKTGKVGEAVQVKEREVSVAQQRAEAVSGQKEAERNQRIRVASLEAEAVSGQKEAEKNQRVKVASYEAEGQAGEAEARRVQEIAVAEQWAKAEQGKKEAERNQRVAVSTLEAEAVSGENQAKAQIADYNAELARRQADAKRVGDVALANATRDVLKAQKEQELARLEKDELAQKEIDKRKVEIDAEAEAERLRRIAKGEADATLAKYQAEARGQQAVLEGKAKGYSDLLMACGAERSLAPTLLVIEKLGELVAEQVKAIQNLHIDKITVWDSGPGANGGQGSTANFLRGMMSSLPPMHELARQAGVELPEWLGNVQGTKPGDPAAPAPLAPKRPTPPAPAAPPAAPRG